MKQTMIRVFFNASVILAGFCSPQGGSGKLLRLLKEKQFIGIISEIVYDEVIRNRDKIKMDEKKISHFLTSCFIISTAPTSIQKNCFSHLMIDEGDTHIFVSAQETQSTILVSLDKKHILILKSNIREFHIMSPKELIEYLQKK